MARGEFPWVAALAGLSTVLGAAGVAVLVGRSGSAAVAGGERRVALVGDSYAVGLGPQLAEVLPHFRYEGHVGTNTQQWAAHAAACGACGDWLRTYRPAVVLVSLGVNDGAAPVLANYQAIVSALHGIGAKVVWIEPPARVNASNVDVPAIRRTIASLGVATVPATRVALAADGLHPQSYAPWASEVAQVAAHVA